MIKPFFCHPNAICETDTIGDGTRIMAFAHIMPNARIGAGCNIYGGVFIENDVSIGDDVTINCGVQLWDGLRVESRVFIGPNTTFTNDHTSRSKVNSDEYLKTRIESNAFIGANATIISGVKIGNNAIIGAGSVVIKDVPAFAKVAGNPAKIIGYTTNIKINDFMNKSIAKKLGNKEEKYYEKVLGECYVKRLPKFSDMRGSLTPLDLKIDFPFKPKRIFFVYGVDSSLSRGEHAHRKCKQFLVAVSGSLSVILDDAHKRIEITLNEPNLGLYVAPMVWGVQYKFSQDAVLLVVCSEEYNSKDYIRDYKVFYDTVQ
jgi:UDP-2-acetamido-3-amino-2,3-dideoxy-glucuronate N-acetyltransferase